jgi:hypothetical protein
VVALGGILVALGAEWYLACGTAAVEYCLVFGG